LPQPSIQSVQQKPSSRNLSGESRLDTVEQILWVNGFVLLANSVGEVFNVRQFVSLLTIYTQDVAESNLLTSFQRFLSNRCEI
jgi:hypothetical protein